MEPCRPEARLGAGKLLVARKSDLCEGTLEIAIEILVAPNEVDADVPIEAVDLVVLHKRPTPATHVRRKGRRAIPAAIAKMVGRHLPVPRVPIEGEFEVVPPDLVVIEQSTGVFGRHMVVETV